MLRPVSLRKESGQLKAEKYLNELHRMAVSISNKRSLKEEYEERATSISTPFGEVKVQCSRSDNGRVERYGTLAADLEREIEQEIERFYAFSWEITQQIHRVHNSKYVELLYRLYVAGVNINNPDQGKCSGYGTKKHSEALEAFEMANADVISAWEQKTKVRA